MRCIPRIPGESFLGLGVGTGNNGFKGKPNRGYGGGISAQSYKVGGKDWRTGNLVIDYNIANVNPDIDALLGTI
jgi:hypothetical protein